MFVQLPLEFKLLDSVNFGSFFAENKTNKQVVHALKNFVLNLNSKELFIYLFGGAKAGKTHLLQAVCNFALDNNVQAVYFPLNQVLAVEPQRDDFFSGLENIQLLCIDDIQLIANNIILEEKLFFLFNNLRAKNNKLIIVANVPPNNLALQLPDLKSRMSWGTTYSIMQLSESEKIAALTMRAAQIGLELNEGVAKFLLTRIKRDPAELFATLKILDHASLAAKRKITIPFVKKILGI